MLLFFPLESHDRKPRNGKKLFLELLQILKGMKKHQNSRRGKTIDSANNHKEHETGITQKIKKNLPGSLHRPHLGKNIPNFGQRSSLLRPVKKIARIGTGQTDKARYSFAQARLSFLKALEIAQDEKLTKIDNLEKKFSFILPKSSNINRQNVKKEVKYALQDFTKDQSATTLSHIDYPNTTFPNKLSQSAIPIKHSRLEETIRKQDNLTNTFDNKNEAIPTKQKPHKILPSLMDELLSISNARSKLEKLRRLRKLQAKLLHQYSQKYSRKDKHESSNNVKNTTSSWRMDDKIENSVTLESLNSSVKNVLHPKRTDGSEMNIYKISRKGVNGKPSKRFKEQHSIKTGGETTLSFLGNKSSDKVSHTNEKQFGEHAKYMLDSYSDFLNSTKDMKHATHSIIENLNQSDTSTQSRLNNSLTSHLNETVQEKHGKMEDVELGGMPLNVHKDQTLIHKAPENESKRITSLPEMSATNIQNAQSKEIDENIRPTNLHNTENRHAKNTEHSYNPFQRLADRQKTTLHETIGENKLNPMGKVNENHENTGNIGSLEKQNNKNLATPGLSTNKNLTMSHDINIIGTTSDKNFQEKDQSYLSSDRLVTSPKTEIKDSKNPLASVLSEHKKIISELTSSKTLAKHISNNKSEKSHKVLSKVLQKAQDIFLEKVKEVLAGNNKNVKQKIDENFVDSKNRDNTGQKEKEGIINSSAYVMDESPTKAKVTQKESHDTSGIVPKTPINDDLLTSPHGNMVPPATQQQNAGPYSPVQSLQTPMDHSPPLQGQSMGHPVSGQPFTNTQLQDAHEEERVALQQENAFRSAQNMANVNGQNQPPLNNVITPYQRCVQVSTFTVKKI